MVYLPPPPASPAAVRGGRRAARGHSRAKSDTTFLKNISNPLSNPFLWEEEKKKCVLSSSTGRLDTGRLDTGRLDTGRLDTAAPVLVHSNANSSESVGRVGGRLQVGYCSLPVSRQV